MAKNKNTIWFVVAGIILLIVILSQTNILKQNKNDNSSGTSVGIHPTFYDANGNVLKGSGAPKVIPNLFSTVAYNNQCTLPSCPSGYTSIGITCDDVAYTCTQTCQQVIPAGCGTFTQATTLTGYSSYTSGNYYSNSYYFNPNGECAEIYSTITFANLGSGNYLIQPPLNVYSRFYVPVGSVLNSSGNTFSSIATGTTYQSPTVTLTNTNQYMYAQGYSTWSGSGYQGMNGAYFNFVGYVSTAPYNTGGTYTTTTSCSYPPPFVSFSAPVTVQNTGTVPYTNVHILNATPSNWASALSTSSADLNPGNSFTFTASNITQQTGTQQAYDVWVSGFNTYTNKTDSVEAKITIQA